LIGISRPKPEAKRTQVWFLWIRLPPRLHAGSDAYPGRDFHCFRASQRRMKAPWIHHFAFGCPRGHEPLLMICLMTWCLWISSGS